MIEKNRVNRYNEAELAEFKAHIDIKVAKTEKQLASLKGQLSDAAESKDNEGDWMDDSSTTTDIEVLEMMVQRQQKHLMDLQNALQRIHNKSYGICSVTGELIDKRRLMAVPTTAKSLAAKIDIAESAKKTIKKEVKAPTKVGAAPKIISRIVRKPSTTVAKPIDWDEEDDLEEGLEEDLDLGGAEIDLDNYSEEDLDLD